MPTAIRGEIQAAFHPKWQVLFEPHRYKIGKSGRYGLKSWSFSQALIILGAMDCNERPICRTGEPLRVLCARETQKSIADSVHALLSDWIRRLGYEYFYTIQKATIVGKNQTSFIFHGLHDLDAIKSAEAIDICYVEEGQTVTKQSLEKLIPTIRKAGSEIWIGYNPELETDPVHQMTINPPPGGVVIESSYRDAEEMGWVSDEMRVEIDYLREQDYQAYLNVYEGHTRSAVEGAVYAEEMKACESAGRITSVAIDRLRPVDTYWDLGYGDSTAVWFAQTFESGQVRIIDYLESRGKTIEWYLLQLQGRQYVYGTDWLPHDGVDAIIHQRLAGDRSKSIEQLMRAAGRNVRVSPKLHIATGINAARTVLGNCWFDRERCNDGLRSLRSYQWGPARAGGLERREPLHDWASHGADGFRTLAVCIKYPEPVAREPQTYQHGWGGGNANKSKAGWMGM